MDPYQKTESTGVSSNVRFIYNNFDGSGEHTARYVGSFLATNQFNGWKNPYWKTQIKSGTSATTPANGSKWEFEDSYLSYFLYYQWKWAGNWYDLQTLDYSGQPFYTQAPSAWSYPPRSSDIDNVVNKVIEKFLNRCDQARSSFESGQDFGELRETLHSITHPLQAARDLCFGYLKKVKKLPKGLKVKNKTHLAKAIADTFLEFKFGWNPLAADIGQGIADLTNNHDHPSVLPVHASDLLTYHANEFHWRVLDGAPLLGAIDTSTGKTTFSYGVAYRGAIRTGAVGGRIPLLQELQLDMPHFVPTLWDLLPYSWIADYFINIGTIIRAASFRQSDLTWAQVTTRSTARTDFYLRLAPDLDFDPNGVRLIQFEVSPCNPSVNHTVFTRAAMTSSDLMPPVTFSIPVSEKPWENMTALLVSRGTGVSRYLRNLLPK